uniref:GON-4-like protein n=1 Tax=Neogobius melanostomus TaxID=47308 RepID=A0A8C6UYA3_9GOBI
MRQHAEKRRNCDPNLLHSKRVRSEYAVSPGPAETSEEDGHGDENQLELDLRRMSRRHNLTKRNVRNILREVITHERVVDMMKAAIRDTQDLPLFEPKMTRSRLKKAVEQGQTVNWSLSAVGSSNRSSGFVDMELEEEEDSSDEEYCPGEEEADTDELFLSDGDSLTSPPRALPGSQTRTAQCLAPSSIPPHAKAAQESTHSPGVKTCRSQTDSFLDRLNAVDEELNSNPAYYYQVEDSLACRTRSKLTLVDVPITRLEAELLAPDFSDMYSSPTHQPTDPHWTQWLQGLVAPDCTEEAEDEDDPEYNVLEDLDEPDLEDYRTDRAVQITKKEVNKLLEELFETLQEQAEDEELEEPDEEEPGLDFLESPLPANGQSVNRQSQTRKALQDTTNTSQIHALSLPPNQVKNQEQLTGSQQFTQLILDPESTGPTLKLSEAQRQHLQQQIQQHVQLLTQVHLLTRGLDALNHEADITKLFLVELDQFSCRRNSPSVSSFKVCNLPLALELIVEDTNSAPHPSAPAPGPAADSKRWLPSMTPATNGHAFPLLPAQLAWLFATQPAFMYPELLPVCSLDPAHHAAHKRQVYTPGEDGLAVLALKHFEGTVNRDQLITDFVLCKNRSNFTKHIRELSSSRAPSNIIKSFFASGGLPHLPLACSKVDPLDLRPPVDRDYSQCPNWLKNSRGIIQKTRQSSSPPTYPRSLPVGCTLRLHPHWLAKGRFSMKQPKRRLFTLAHNGTLMPLAKKHGTLEKNIASTDLEELNGDDGIPLTRQTSSSKEKLKGCQTDYTAVISTPSQNVLEVHSQKHPVLSVLLPVGSEETVPLGHPSASGHSNNERKGMYDNDRTEKKQLGKNLNEKEIDQNCEREERGVDDEGGGVNKEANEGHCEGENEGELEGGWTDETGGAHKGGGVNERVCANDAGGSNEAEGENNEGEANEGGGANERNFEGGGDNDGGGANKDYGEKEGASEGQRPNQGGDSGGGGPGRTGDGGGDDAGDYEEEEEEFDDLTQDEDEEEVMSSASEESVLSVPELQETMKQLTWLAAERRLGDGDSEDDLSQEDEEEDEEDGNSKGEESREERGTEIRGDKDTTAGEDHALRAKRGPARGRGRSRPPRMLTRSRQDRISKDASKLLLLYDENILENDPHRDCKDTAFAQSYLNRVQEALQDVPLKMEQFVSLLGEFEKIGELQDVVTLFHKLQCILGPRTDLLRDFAAFLRPEQALECGLFNEQQAFDRSRRFLRQLEISFGDNPSHYQKIIKALQMGPDLSPTSVHELKSQIKCLLKGHTHLQSELWVFFDELRPPPARPGQFEEAQWPEEAEGREGSGGCDMSGFEEVTLPEPDEEEDRPKIITVRQPRRKMDSHRNYKPCDWSEKAWVCLCHDAPNRKHRKKGCPQCKGLVVVSRAMKRLHPLYSQMTCDKDPSHLAEHSVSTWEGGLIPAGEEDEDMAETKREPSEKSSEESSAIMKDVTESSPSSVFQPDVSQTVVPALSQELTVCAKNISLTASGEKVVLWTRDADRVILTWCQQEGANPSTFHHISSVLGNKTPCQVSQRFQDLMRLFHTTARHNSEDETSVPEQTLCHQED